MRRVFIVALALAAGCSNSKPHIKCSVDSECILPGRPAVCVQNACAVPDLTCPSNYRFDTRAGESGACVELPGVDMSNGETGDIAMSTSSDMASTSPGDMSGPMTWTPATVTGDFYGVWARSPSDVYVVGAGGLIMHSTGDGKWSSPITSGTTGTLRAIWGDAATGDIWIGGDGPTLLHSSDGQTWKQETMTEALGSSVLAIWGTDHTNVWASGNGKLGQIVHSTGGGVWGASAGTNPAPKGYFVGIHGTNDVAYAVDSSEVYKWDGTRWVNDFTDPKGGIFNNVWMVGPTDIYAASNIGVFYSKGNGQWTNQTPGARPDGNPGAINFQHVWGTAPDNIYGLGGGASPYFTHSIGNGLWPQSTDVPSMAVARSIYGATADDIYVVGQNNLIVHGHR